MKKFLLPAMGVAFLCLAVAGCSKENETALRGNSGNTCDTVNMTYSADVLPIIQRNCYACHSNEQMTGVSLGNYTALKVQADNGNLIGVINHASGYPAMPEGGAKLSDCDINKIQDWINHGAQNN